MREECNTTRRTAGEIRNLREASQAKQESGVIKASCEFLPLGRAEDETAASAAAEHGDVLESPMARGGECLHLARFLLHKR